jgi:transcriptional regulator with XRE-family HTH domain
MTLERVDLKRVADLLAQRNTATDSVDHEETTCARQVGQRLRAVRHQQGLSLHQVEAATAQEFKAAVLGAYERGERAISLARLQRLARVYNVPTGQLVPQGGDVSGPWEGVPFGSAARVNNGFVVDLQRLEHEGAPDHLLQRYVRMIQVQRSDFNGRMITLRNEDARALACLLGTPLEELASDCRLAPSNTTRRTCPATG